MKTFLLATAAVTLAGTAAWAFDDDNRQGRARAANDHTMTWNQDGTVIEIRGDDGERTIHMPGGSDDATLTINGQEIRIRGHQVLVDGQEVQTDGAAIVIVDGDEIRIVGDGDGHRFDRQFAYHMAERAEDMARMGAEMEHFRFDFDSEGMQAEVMASLEAALAGLEHDIAIDGGSHDWETLTEAERAGVRESLEEARQEIREAMEEMRAEMHEVRRAGDQSRRVRVELSHAARDARHADRDEARALRDAARAERDEHRAARDQARAARDSAHTERDHTMRWEMLTDDPDASARSIRVERGDDGRRQVWVNDEEQTGDDLVRWLNQIEAERLAGGPVGDNIRRERRIVRLNRHDGSSDDIDLTNRRVIVLRSEDGDNGERVFEFEIEDDETDDGE